MGEKGREVRGLRTQEITPSNHHPGYSVYSSVFLAENRAKVNIRML